jgi:hypothetical protein
LAQNIPIPGSGAFTLSLRQDEFSAQFSRPGDPHFWIRIELPLSDKLMISDFFPGELDDYQMAAAFAQALERLEIRRLSSLSFRKLGPVGSADNCETIRRIGRVLDAFAVLTRRFIDSRQVLAEQGQSHLLVKFVLLLHPGGRA